MEGVFDVAFPGEHAIIFESSKGLEE